MKDEGTSTATAYVAPAIERREAVSGLMTNHNSYKPPDWNHEDN
ncbi:MAG TPA: hypothetical protein VGP92_09725 [Acidimicrobiia bacterium]|jgi:hypothetical protein|nr:hypothetical protein [Acidimicrobiia bacterium]